MCLLSQPPNGSQSKIDNQVATQSDCCTADQRSSPENGCQAIQNHFVGVSIKGQFRDRMVGLLGFSRERKRVRACPR